MSGLCESWQSRRNTSLLVKYEDLLRQPDIEHERIRHYTGAHFDAVPDSEDSSKADALLSEHRTTSSPEASIGRWKEVLSSKEKAVCHEVLQPCLDVFGYA